MAFKLIQGGSKPAMTVRLTVKQGNSYVPIGSFGLWVNDQGGPAFRGTLKGDKLNEVAEGLANAIEAGLSVVASVFDNSQEQQPAAPAAAPASKPSPFKKPGGFAPAKKPNPFAQKE